MINFVTLFPEGKNIELIKVVGQIPYNINKKEDVRAVLAMGEINLNGYYITDVSDMELVRLPIIISNYSLSGAMYILKNARKIDWLHIFHAGRRSYYWAKMFKALNHRGKVYLSLDVDYRGCDIYDENNRERKRFSKSVNEADLVSCESETVKQRIQKYSRKEIKIIPSGYAKIKLDGHSFPEREKTFITVARLGTKQKATDVLLEAFALSASKHDWNLILIGEIENGFNEYTEYFFTKYPDLRKRIEFLGEINDRNQLYRQYYKARVFVLPSRWESFGIVCVEALGCGCRLIISDKVPPANEFTCNEKYGKIVKSDDIKMLSKAMFEATLETYTDKITDEIIEYAERNFSWEIIVDRLYQYIYDNEPGG